MTPQPTPTDQRIADLKRQLDEANAEGRVGAVNRLSHEIAVLEALPEPAQPEDEDLRAEVGGMLHWSYRANGHPGAGGRKWKSPEGSFYEREPYIVTALVALIERAMAEACGHCASPYKHPARPPLREGKGMRVQR